MKTASRQPCPARVKGREECQLSARRNARFCAYHDARSRTEDVDVSRWCSWISAKNAWRCQRWALRVSDRCSDHDPERSAESSLSRRVQRNAWSEAISHLAEMHDAEKKEEIPGLARMVQALADRSIYDARRHDALTEFADVLGAVYEAGPVDDRVAEALGRRYDKAMMRIISLDLQPLPGIDSLAAGWIASKKRFGDKEALRWARQGLEKGVKRPHTPEDLRIAEATQAAIVKQQRAIVEPRRAGKGKVRKVIWSIVQRDVERATCRRFGSLESFNKWVVHHISDLLDELPPRGTRRRR